MTAAPSETFLQKQLRLKAERERAALEQASAAVPTRPVTSGPLDTSNPRAQRWVAVKVDAGLADLAAMGPDSGRNDRLNALAYSFGRLTPKWLDEQDITERLYDAARACGLEHAETVATIRSGLRKGTQDPRDPPISDDDSLVSLVHGTVTSLPPRAVVRADGVTVDPATGEVVEAATAPVLQPFAGLDLSLLDGPLPDLDWLIDGRMTRKTLTLLGSKPGVGKSWLAQAAALGISTGQTWLGHDCQPGRVLYLDAENGDRLALRRLQQLGAEAGQIGDRLKYVTESMVFPTPRDDHRLRATLAEYQPDLVIVDTLASIAPTAESGTEEASTFLASVWHAVRDSGAAMLLLCHLRKVQQGAGKDDPLSSFRGAGHLVGAAHRAWVLDPIGDERFVLRDVKTREFAAVAPVRLRLVDSGEGQQLRTDLEVEGTEAQVEDGYDAYLANVLTFIDRHPTAEAKTSDLLALSTSETSRTLERYLDRALAAGVLVKARRGYWKRGGDALASGMGA